MGSLSQKLQNREEKSLEGDEKKRRSEVFATPRYSNNLSSDPATGAADEHILM